MQAVKKNLVLSLLFTVCSLEFNALQAAEAAEASKNATEISLEKMENEYIYGADSAGYSGGLLANMVFVVNDKIPDGYRVGYLGYKFKDSSKADEWTAKFWDFFANTAVASIKSKQPIPADKLQEFEDYCDSILDSTQVKFFTAAEAAAGDMQKEGYGAKFSNAYSLISADNKVISAEWLADPNKQILLGAKIQGADDTVLWRWKNPEYKAPDVTCKAGEGISTATDENGNVTNVAVMPETTKEFAFADSDFAQKFLVVANAEEVASVPGGLEEITKRVIQLFSDMPKVAATIISRMVTSDGALAVCPIVDDIDGKQFKAAIMFAADTVPEDAKNLADKLDETFSILKKQVMSEMSSHIDAEHQRLTEEHKQKLAEHEARAEAAKQGDVNVGGYGSETMNSLESHPDHMGKTEEDPALVKQREQLQLSQDIKDLQRDVGGTIDALQNHARGSEIVSG